MMALYNKKNQYFFVKFNFICNYFPSYIQILRLKYLINLKYIYYIVRILYIMYIVSLIKTSAVLTTSSTIIIQIADV